MSIFCRGNTLKPFNCTEIAVKPSSAQNILISGTTIKFYPSKQIFFFFGRVLPLHFREMEGKVFSFANSHLEAGVSAEGEAFRRPVGSGTQQD
jgi:hypothetical protein